MLKYFTMTQIPGSQDSQAKAFNVENKQSFPHKFASASTLNYIGDKPNAEYYYDTYRTSAILPAPFNFKLESISYLTADCTILLNILENFMISFSDKYIMNPLESLTISSQAMKLYRAKYYNTDIKVPTC